MSILKDIIIKKLKPNNYYVWKFRTEMYLQKEDLYSVIINDPPNPMTDDFGNKNRKARAIINLLMDDNQIIREEFRKRTRLLERFKRHLRRLEPEL